ncbi:hypothetical protein ACP70R_015494 [Stipagrostis hirtigluma subsp. patula]
MAKGAAAVAARERKGATVQEHGGDDGGGGGGERWRGRSCGGGSSRWSGCGGKFQAWIWTGRSPSWWPLLHRRRLGWVPFFQQPSHRWEPSVRWRGPLNQRHTRLRQHSSLPRRLPLDFSNWSTWDMDPRRGFMSFLHNQPQQSQYQNFHFPGAHSHSASPSLVETITPQSTEKQPDKETVNVDKK